MAKSIIQETKDCCYLCGRNGGYWGLDEHHVFGGRGIRPLSEKYGLKVYLCHDTCHEFGENSVQKNAKVNRALKASVQKMAMEHYGWDEQSFVQIFGKSYLRGVDQI